MKYDTFYNMVNKTDYKLAKFDNRYKERFYLILTSGVPFRQLFITGDEFDWVMIPLFNREFNIYSNEELRLLGKAFQEIANE